MDAWLLVLLSITVSAALALLLRPSSSKRRLPPGPPAVPLLGNLLWLRHSTRDLEPLLHELHHKYGPILTLRIGSRPIIIIADRAIAHKALVDHGAVFADRPAPLPASLFVNNNQPSITSAGYGPLWRLLRRNLTSEILHSSRVKLYGPGRSWVLAVLTHQLRSGAGATESFQFAMFCLLVLMCFGEKLGERAIRDIEAAERGLLLYSGKLSVFAFAPRISKYVFRKRWSRLLELRARMMELYVPLIAARREHKLKPSQSPTSPAEERYVYSYLDSLLDIELPEEGGRRLTDSELVALCSEFLTAGTDTTSTALQWIMARLVKHQDVQERLAAEIQSVVGGGGTVEEEDLHNMAYLKAVVLEGLRLHSPAHFVLPHTVTEETSIEGYIIPKGASVNFMVAGINRDGEVWEEPMEFKPERFLAGGAVVDITGSREITMMPFGVGRRICPAHGLAMLHLEYFVANLVNQLEWKTVEGEEVDFSEKQEFTTVMKNPLRACISPRLRLANNTKHP